MNPPAAPAGGDSPAARLSPGWWRPALTRPERAGLTNPVTPVPAWAVLAEQAAAAAAPPDPMPCPGSWQEAFAVPFQPLLAEVRERVIAGAGRCLPPAQADPGPVARTLTAALGRRLARLAARALAAELDEAGSGGRLAGADGRQRFEDFLRRQSSAAGLTALFGKYPVLARLLATASSTAAEAGLELLQRFAADRAAVVTTLLGATDPGPLVAVEPGLGDLHRRGRSVTALCFADGRKVIYKPRSVQSQVLLGDVAAWLGQRVPQAGLRAPQIVARPGYGWAEFIAHRPLTRPGQAEEFYRREGVLLAALHAMQAVDIHCENLIACADQPVLVDAETLFHPVLPIARTTAADPAAEALAASVYRTALLPYLDVGENGVLDRSGMGGDQGVTCPHPVLDWDPPASGDARLIWRAAPFEGADNRPHADGTAIEPADHAAAVLEGFRLGHDAIARDRQAFSRLIESAGDIDVRVIVRPSNAYARLLDESTQPALLRDARRREKAFGVLHELPGHHVLWRRLARHEIADLREGDIPLLTSRPAAADGWTSTGQRLPGLLGRTGLGHALEKIAAMDEVDRRDQEWVISASLAARRPAGGHHSIEPMPGPLTASAVQPSRLLVVACGLADQIVARGRAGTDGPGRRRVNWLGLQLVDDSRWMVLPMGAGLADGYVGVALFLTQLASLTGIGRYAEEARRAVSELPRLCEVLRGRSDLLAAVGCGGTAGLGGISYGLARIATLLDDAEVRGWAETAVQVTAEAADVSAAPGWTHGSAGCLAAMIAVQAEQESAAAASLARACADRLADLVDRTDGRCGPDGDDAPRGFAAGPAGIGWALTRFAAVAAEPRYSLTGRSAVRRAGEPVFAAGRPRADGWCSGAAGLLMTGTCLADARPAGHRAAVQALNERPVLRDLSLCHGELGITEALIAISARAGQDEAVARALRRRAGLIVGAIGRHDRYCGTPGGISTPGLLSGLAGIGYGLLRLAFPQRVPSVLLLEPTPDQPGTAGRLTSARNPGQNEAKTQ